MAMQSASEAIMAEIAAEIAEYPEEEADILLEGAHRSLGAGLIDQAIELYHQCIARGGEDRAWARCALAELFFQLQRDAEARQQLALMLNERHPSPAPYELVGELLEERGELQEALRWFNLATSRGDENELNSVRNHPLSDADVTLAGRLRVRRELGLARDDLDCLAIESESYRLEWVAQLREYLSLAKNGRSARVLTIRISFWPRADIPRAHKLWPTLVEHVDAASYVCERELVNRCLTDDGHMVQMVPLTVDELSEYAERHQLDPTDEHTRGQLVDELAEDGRAIHWPPGRNARCWCGSGRKYKQCCLRISDL